MNEFKSKVRELQHAQDTSSEALEEQKTIMQRAQREADRIERDRKDIEAEWDALEERAIARLRKEPWIWKRIKWSDYDFWRHADGRYYDTATEACAALDLDPIKDAEDEQN